MKRIEKNCYDDEDREIIEEMFSNCESEDELQDAIESLPPQQRKVAASRKDGLSNAEIAEKLDLSLNTVNVHYRLGLKALRNKLKHLIVLVIILCLC